jgi:hypothetical protein
MRTLYEYPMISLFGHEASEVKDKQSYDRSPDRPNPLTTHKMCYPMLHIRRSLI